MGLLDDAIREHLELKRQHGADAGEVARQEHEALGPVRREDIAIPDAVAPPFDDAPEPVAVPERPASEDPTLYLPPEPEPEPSPAPPASVSYEPPAEPAPAEAPVPEPDPGQNTVAFSLEDLEDAASPVSAPEPPAGDPGPAIPTQDLAWDAPPAEPAPEPVAPDVVPADEEPVDELEETPEFLEETPEHDRLWFEQKPPRDFDF